MHHAKVKVMDIIETPKAPIPAGHYSQAIVANGLIFLAGQLPITPGKERHIPEGIKAQTHQVFSNLRAILQEAGSDLNDLVSVQIFIPNMRLWGNINDVYASILGSHKPARTIVPCGTLHHEALIEVNAVALHRRNTTHF
jgi:2-iminobutanoate/2-iminopropanoate deaminase